ncbi:hypothetical protein ACFL5O_01035 [Myxococcota bacterium]
MSHSEQQPHRNSNEWTDGGGTHALSGAGSPEADVLEPSVHNAKAVVEAVERLDESVLVLSGAAANVGFCLGQLSQLSHDLTTELHRAEQLLLEREQQSGELAQRLTELAAELAQQREEVEQKQAEATARQASDATAREAQLASLRAELAAEKLRGQSQLEARSALLHTEFDRQRAADRSAFEARVSTLERELDSLRTEYAQALEANAAWVRERDFLLHEQDRFVASMAQEYEGKLGALTPAQDPARADSGARPSDRPARAVPIFDPTSKPGDSPAPRRLTSNQFELDRHSTAAAAERVAELEEQVDQLRHERELSRELVRRLQTQRDEALETTAHLRRQLETGERTTDSARASRPEIEVPPSSAGPDSPALGVIAIEPSAGQARGPSGPGPDPAEPETTGIPRPSDNGDGLRNEEGVRASPLRKDEGAQEPQEFKRMAGHQPAPAAVDSTVRLALIAALARSDPSRRNRGMARGTDGKGNQPGSDEKPPDVGHREPVVTHSRQDVDSSEKTGSKPPQR